jgi:6,7-dimethyl-8-ribityllumazine synthase
VTARVLIVEGRFHEHIANALLDGATAALETAGVNFERVTVPGALEIPPVISFAARVGEEDAEPFDGYVALGCVIRDESLNFDVIAREAVRGLMNLALERHLCIGNGILAVDGEDQAMRYAARDQLDMGGEASRACLALINARAKLWSRG